MLRPVGTGMVLALALAACGPQAADKVAGEAAQPESEFFARDALQAAPAPAPPPPPGQPVPQQPGAPAAQNILLAYAYAMGLEVPADKVEPVMKAHEAACIAAGANLCQVLGASTNAYGENDIRAQIQLRAEPKWLAGFRERLESDAKGVGGRIVSTNQTSEDLTRAITDTEATLRAQRTLRDRLQQILASRPARVADLLEVERELARVQGEIDAQQSNLAVMRARVNMSTLTIDYSSAGAPLTDTTFEPLANAFTDFLRVVAQSLAAIILFIAAALPWAAIGLGLGWLALKWRRRRRAGKASLAATDAQT